MVARVELAEEPAAENQCSSALGDALAYAARGWPVFPCRADKRPFTRNGFKDASADSEQIRAWWRRWPSAQVGVACGAAGIAVIDLDLKPSESKDGIAAFDVRCGLRSRGAALVASTPRGGRHLFYRASTARPLGNAVDIEGSGIDVRGDGGYVILPSANSPGRTWLEGDPSDELDPMPGWLDAELRELCGSKRATGSGDRRDGASGPLRPADPAELAAVRSALRYIDGEGRNNWLRVGMALKSSDWSEARGLWDEWSQRWPHKFDAADQDYQWQSLVSFRMDGTEITLGTLFHMAKAGGWTAAVDAEASTLSAARVEVVEEEEPDDDTPEQFPADLYSGGDLLSLAVRWTIETAPRPQPALAFGAWMAALGSVVGRRVQTVTRLRTNLYALGIGPTACGKDFAQRAVGVGFHHAGLDRRLTGGWASGSAVASAVAAQPSQCAIVDELGQRLLVTANARSAPHLADMKRYWLELFSSAGSVFRGNSYADRKASPTVTIDEPNLCVYGVGTPDVLFEALSAASVGDGLLNRFLVFPVPADRPRMRFVGDQPEQLAEIVERLRRLDEDSRPPGHEGLAPGDDVAAPFATGCRVLPFSDGGRAVRDLVDEADDRLDDLTRRDERSADLWARFAEHVQKLALLRAVVVDPRAAEITDEDLQWARRVALWCHLRMQKLAGDRISESTAEATKKRLLRVIAAAGPSGLSGTLLSRQTQWLDRRTRKDAILDLIEAGQVLAQESSNARKPATTYIAARHAGGVR